VPQGRTQLIPFFATADYVAQLVQEADGRGVAASTEGLYWDETRQLWVAAVTVGYTAT